MDIISLTNLKFKIMNLLKYIFIICLLVFFAACSDDDSATPQEPQKVELKTNNSLLTVINLMKPDSANQEATLNFLQAGLEQTMSKQPGFVSSSLHKSLDNNYIINYAQWETGEDLQAASDLVNGGGAPNMAEAFGMSSPDFHPFNLMAQYKSGDSLPKIDEAGELLTIINVLQPIAGVTQQELATMLKEAIEEEVLPQDGFISATIHESLDNDYIINYAQWRDEAALDGIVERLQTGNAPKLGTAFSNATPDFHPFSVVNSYFSE